MPFKKILILFVLTFAMVLSAVGFAKSPVYKVSKGNDYLYVGGTIHLLSPNDYPLPQGFGVAFEDSTLVFFEVDGAVLNAPETQEKLLGILTFQDDRTLETVLNKETYDLLSAAFAERQLPISAFSSYTPAGISLTLVVLELQRLGLGNPANGVDHFYQLKTNQDDSKEVDFLETVDQQIGFLNELNMVDPNVIIKSNLEDLTALKESWEQGLSAWRSGNLSVMGEALGGEKMKIEFPSVYDALLTKRNQHWVTQIKPMFDTPEIELLLVGAMHLVGDDGVIELLRELGYQVEQLH